MTGTWNGWIPGIAVVVAVAGVVAMGPSLAAAQPSSGPGADHVVILADSDTAVRGDNRALSLAITPSPGYSISRDGPLTVALSVTPDEGITLPRRTYQRRHAADPRAASPRFDLAYGADRAGRYTMTVSLGFWICGKHTCWPVRHTRRVQITVSPPAKR